MDNDQSRRPARNALGTFTYGLLLGGGIAVSVAIVLVVTLLVINQIGEYRIQQQARATATAVASVAQATQTAVAERQAPAQAAATHYAASIATPGSSGPFVVSGMSSTPTTTDCTDSRLIFVSDVQVTWNASPQAKTMVGNFAFVEGSVHNTCNYAIAAFPLITARDFITARDSNGNPITSFRGPIVDQGDTFAPVPDRIPPGAHKFQISLGGARPVRDVHEVTVKVAIRGL